MKPTKLNYLPPGEVYEYNFLEQINARSPLQPVNLTAAGSLLVGGTVIGSTSRANLYVPALANQSGVMWSSGYLSFLPCRGKTLAYPDYSQNWTMYFWLCRTTVDAQAVSHAGLSRAMILADLAAWGVEVKIVNMRIYLDSYRTALGHVDSGFDLTTIAAIRVKIKMLPSVPKIELYIDSGAGFPTTPNCIQTDTTMIPQALESNLVRFVTQHQNGAAGVSSMFDVAWPFIASPG